MSIEQRGSNKYGSAVWPRIKEADPKTRRLTAIMMMISYFVLLFFKKKNIFLFLMRTGADKEKKQQLD